MKKQLLLIAVSLFAARTVSYSQELLVGGNMEDESSWHFSSRTDKTDKVEATFNYTSDLPSGGSDGCLELTGMGDNESYTWQQVTIVPGHKYYFSGLLKSISGETVTNTWAEALLSRNKPDSSQGYGAVNGDYWYTNSTWKSDPYGNFDGLDGTFEDVTELIWKGMKGGSDSILKSPEITIPDTVTDAEWYIVIKTGCMNSVGGGPTFDFLFDNLSLNDITNANSVAQLNIGNQISMFPNPSKGIVNFKSGENIDGLKYDIYNVSGILVKSGNLDNKQNLDLTAFVKGVYIVKLDNKSSMEFYKLVIR